MLGLMAMSSLYGVIKVQLVGNCCHPLVVADIFSFWNNIKDNIPFHWFYFRALSLWFWPSDGMHDWNSLSGSPQLIDIRPCFRGRNPWRSQFFSLKSNASKGDKAVTNNWIKQCSYPCFGSSAEDLRHILSEHNWRHCCF